MTDLSLQSLLTTLQHRPYVAAFLLVFFLIGILNRGIARTLLFLLIGYLVAFLSEFCSIHWGFPYGMYHYIYENMSGELILAGVPVWDSISYVFMAYASYEMAVFTGPIGPIRLIGPILLVLLDIVTDPLAVRGDQWFLGKIFYYPNGGLYFGVPLSNFAGWFLVGLVIFSIYAWLECKLPHPHPLSRQGERGAPILGPLFYFSIMLFNLVITFWIGEWKLGLVSSGITLGILSRLPAVRGVLRHRS